jgi:hypothetical protein
VFVADAGEEHRFEAFGVSVLGGRPVRLSAPLVAGGDVLDFELAPHGRRLLYRADQEVDERHELYSVSAGSVVKLNGALDAGASVAGWAFSPSGTVVVFRTEGTRGLFRVPADGSAPAAEIRLPDGTAVNLPTDSYRIASDGARVVFGTAEGLFAAPLAGGPTLELGADLGAFEIGGFVLSPDASRVAFLARLGPADPTALYTTPLAGGPSSPITGSGPVHEVRFSAPGDRVLFTSERGPLGLGLFVAPATGGAGLLLSGTLDVRTFATQPADVLVGFTAAGDRLYVAPLDGSAAPQRVGELDLRVSQFVLGRERAFYLAAPPDSPATAELYSRTYASLP